MRSRIFVPLLIAFSILFLLVSIYFVRLCRTTRDRIEGSMLELLQSRQSREVCDAREDIDTQPFKSWNQSVVTLIEPQIPRNCSALFQGDEQEINKVANAKQNWKSSAYNQKFNSLYIDSTDCEDIRAEFEGNFYVSEDELSFPLAFSMTVHSEAQQIIRFLKVIYRPHNVYCIHYDQKSSSTFRRIFNTLAKCLENVIIPKKTVSIVYGCYPILEAQLSCMSDLLEIRSKYPWKYTTTLCGKEVPLRTNREMVDLLQTMNGLPVLYAHEFLSGEYSLKMHKMVIKHSDCKPTWKFHNRPIPYGLKLLKSMAYFSLTPEFTNFIVNSPEAKALYNFVKPIKGPEEAYYGTLFKYWLNGTEENVAIPMIAETIWLPLDDHKWEKHCSGSVIHRVCIVSSGDLHRIKHSGRRFPLFHNKYSMAEDHTLMDCVEELLVKKNKEEFVRDECKHRMMGRDRLPLL